MAKFMKVTALTAVLLTAVCALLHLNTQSPMLLPLVITLATTAYHFVMRLLVGWTLDGLFHNRMNPHARWFRVSVKEQAVYKRLGIQKWKGGIPTYEPRYFDRKLHTWAEIAQATCQAELVHEIIIALSFLPILASVPFGEFWVFFITSFLAACVDGVFVILQRYNRPRLLAIAERKESKH